MQTHWMDHVYAQPPHNMGIYFLAPHSIPLLIFFVSVPFSWLTSSLYFPSFPLSHGYSGFTNSMQYMDRTTTSPNKMYHDILSEERENREER